MAWTPASPFFCGEMTMQSRVEIPRLLSFSVTIWIAVAAARSASCRSTQ